MRVSDQSLRHHFIGPCQKCAGSLSYIFLHEIEKVFENIPLQVSDNTTWEEPPKDLDFRERIFSNDIDSTFRIFSKLETNMGKPMYVRAGHSIPIARNLGKTRLKVNCRRYGNREIVRLIVGEERVVFEVHLGTLCEASAYFTATFSKYHFAESHSRELVINEDPDTVDLFIEWAYSSSLDENVEDAAEMNAWAMELAKLYIFANKYLVIQLESQLVYLLQDLSEKCSEAPQFAVVEYVYQNTIPKMTEVREILTTWLITKSDPTNLKERMRGELLSLPECLADLAIAFQARFSYHYQLGLNDAAKGIDDTWY